jgi:hypothetical protein
MHGGYSMCDKKSIRELREESALKELWHRVNEIVEPPLTAEELLQKKKKKDSERKEMEFIREYMR